MAYLSYPAATPRAAAAVIGRAAARWEGLMVPARAMRTLQDQRLVRATNGTITDNNRVMVKTAADAPEVPMAGARVRLHRLVDGYLAWQGISDAAGWYWPTGLEVGVAYIPLAIDLSGTYECDAAGPVIAVEEA